ncbi:hypothetical protein U5G49_000411 [Rhizobium indigoferae]|uniref:Uncharacterized protein n=1 Tax=Rhizobium indigoferae TaxID=158891 RepID=A0ABZ0Z9Q8_9HYPH|nr:hypothetical protein [Rhizobium indigoferae]WQN35380.1 hypothetical protein U5G49_000411 [Rhizobium indigoferae]
MVATAEALRQPLREPVEAMSISQKKPHWAARKIRELLVKRVAGDVGLRVEQRTLRPIGNPFATRLSPMS